MSLIRDADLLNEDGSPSIALLRNCIQEHKQQCERLKLLHDYYYGDHKIKDRVRDNPKAPNNKLVCNHAEYIVDMSTGYFLGNPIKYRTESIDSDGEAKELVITPITDNFKDVDIHSHDVELDRDRSIYGIALELPFATDDDSPKIDFAEISPEHGFLVVDDTVKHKPLFGVNYYPQLDVNMVLSNYVINVYTAYKAYTYKSKVLDEPSTYDLVDEQDHYFGIVPFIEYKNKKSCQGDFESVISLIDAYNVLQSDRVNDKEQFVNAILVVIGASLGDDIEEASNTVKALRDLGVLELPDKDAQALYLQKSFTESEVEVLKKSIKDDIHEFSKVPCLSDANFASTDSGVALAYKLLAFEMLVKQKENFFRQGLKQRLKLMCNFYNTKGQNLDAGCIDVEFSRSLPINRKELVDMVVALDGIVSSETRLSLLDFIDDPSEELKKLKADLKEKVKQQQDAFGSYEFKQGNEEEDEEEPPKEDGEVDEE